MELGWPPAEQDGNRQLFKPTPPGVPPVPKEGILVIAGGKGTGKTSLASFVKRRVLQKSSIPTVNWKDFETGFPWVADPTRPTLFVDRMTALRATLTGALSNGRENVFLFLDDVPPAGFDAVLNLYQDFKDHNQIYVVTTTDVALAQKELNWTVAARVKVLQPRNVNVAELQAYIAERVALYRDPNRAEFDNLSKIFPWAMSAAARLVGATPDADQPLRLLNRWLSEEVTDFHTKRSADPAVDLPNLPQAALAALMIP